MIYLLDTELNRLGAVNNVASCVVSESLQGEYTASIAIVSDIVEIENTESILEIDGDYFDISLLEIEKTGDKIIQKIELEHVSYRLSNEEYDLEYFTYDGDLRGCVAALLDGTEFSLGDIEQDTEIFTISLQQKITRRAALLALAQQKQMEIFFEKFKVHVKKKRGSDNGVYVRFGKNLKSLKKRVEKKNGNMNLSYDIDVALVDELGSVCVGDTVYVKDDGLKIFSSMRVVQREYDAINLKNQKLTLANYTSDISDLFLSIERSVVKKDTLYNGVKISAENGLEVFRSDGKVRTVLNATEGIKIESDTGEGLQEVFFVDTDGNLKAIRLTAQELVIEDGNNRALLDAKNRILYLDNFDVIVGELMAERIKTELLETVMVTADDGFINDLTVNRLKTLVDRGTDSVNYIDIKDNIAAWITGEKIPGSEFHVQNSKGQYLFWVDESKKQITTRETEFPVIAYRFNELVKLKIHFNSQDPNDIPIIELGAGNENGLRKGYIYKDTLGLHLKYLDRYSKEHTISMTDDGILINGEKAVTHVEYATLYDSGALRFKKIYYNQPTVFIQGGTYSFIKDRGLFTGLDVNVIDRICNIAVFGG